MRCESNLTGKARAVNEMGRSGEAKLSRKELWGMEAFQISFLLQATYDVLPSPVNLSVDLNQRLCFPAEI